MLYAAHEDQEAVTEYRAALAGTPDDAALKRGLERARKKLGQDTAKAASSRPRPRACRGRRPSPPTKSLPTPSPRQRRAEPAAEEQQ